MSSRVLVPSDPAPVEAELAVCPSARSGSVYVLDESRCDELVPRVVDTLTGLEGVDLRRVAGERRGCGSVRSG